MNNLNFEKLRTIIVSLTMIMLYSCGLSGQEKKASLQPNVLMIVVDDLNDWVGCMKGHPDTKTPNIDKLASEGVLFTNAHAAAPLCSPSRIAAITGIHPTNSGFYMNSQGNFRSKLKDIETLPEYFKKNGYYVVGAGKIYPDSKEGYKKSFQEFIHVDSSSISNTNNYIYNNGPVGRFKNWVLDGGPLDVTDDQMVDGANANWLINKIENTNFQKPFFMTFGVFRPHIDWFVPRKYFKKFDPEKIHLADVKENDLDDVPDYGKELANCTQDAATLKRCNQTKEATAAYLASINFADAMIGKVLKSLKKSKYADNTIVILWSDHGYHHGEKNHWRKFTLWDEATRVPFIVKAPNITQSGVKCNQPISLIDIFPTLTDLCGLPSVESNDGKSIVPLLVSNTANWDRPVLVTYGRGNNSIKAEKYNYIQYEDGSEELYYKKNDPKEWNNLARNTDYDSIRNSLMKYLPKNSAPNQPKANGNTSIELWHKSYGYIIGKDIEFLDW